MKLTCLGSGSAGNCYLLHNDTECLVIEAGISFREVKKAIDFDTSKIVGVVVSHEHKDHAGYINDYLKDGIPVLRPWYMDELDSYSYPPTASYCYLPFAIKSFALEHDVPCYGFLVQHDEIGRLLFITDTEYVKYRFKNVEHILIECNYSKDLIEDMYNKILQNRIKLTHMELDTCKDFVRENNNPDLKTVCLLHLSDHTSDEKVFKEEIQSIVDCPVYIAGKGFEIEL